LVNHWDDSVALSLSTIFYSDYINNEIFLDTGIHVSWIWPNVNFCSRSWRQRRHGISQNSCCPTR